eukprot:CAMPEP_0194318004 /NCGR_PEP_ID=MMETSP0171-20130528/14657_1 /TAXON_ID=218684 /ORGANISM="Corethron pennatum, Strain L29A3" /LENGTH=1132 /DNA_ID=CAMNT_0039074767 /DNA_START=101 /DNA_END=3499 /DNA_ORIENTATION=-
MPQDVSTRPTVDPTSPLDAIRRRRRLRARGPPSASASVAHSKALLSSAAGPCAGERPGTPEALRGRRACTTAGADAGPTPLARRAGPAALSLIGGANARLSAEFQFPGKAAALGVGPRDGVPEFGGAFICISSGLGRAEKGWRGSGGSGTGELEAYLFGRNMSRTREESEHNNKTKNNDEEKKFIAQGRELKEARPETEKTRKMEVQKNHRVALLKAERCGSERLGSEQLDNDQMETGKNGAEQCGVENEQTETEWSETEKKEVKRPEAKSQLKEEQNESEQVDCKLVTESLENERMETKKGAAKCRLELQENEKTEAEPPDTKKKVVKRPEVDPPLKAEQTEAVRESDEQLVTVSLENERMEIKKEETEQCEVELQENEQTQAEQTKAEEKKITLPVVEPPLKLDRLKAERMADEQLVTGNLDNERTKTGKRGAEQCGVKRLENEQTETERTETGKKEVKRLEAELSLKVERPEAERVDDKQLVTEKREAAMLKVYGCLEENPLKSERQKLERLEAERLETELIEAERIKAEQLEAERIEVEKPRAEEEEKKLTGTMVETKGAEETKLQFIRLKEEDRIMKDEEERLILEARVAEKAKLKADKINARGFVFKEDWENQVKGKADATVKEKANFKEKLANLEEKNHRIMEDRDAGLARQSENKRLKDEERLSKGENIQIVEAIATSQENLEKDRLEVESLGAGEEQLQKNVKTEEARSEVKRPKSEKREQNLREAREETNAMNKIELVTEQFTRLEEGDRNSMEEEDGKVRKEEKIEVENAESNSSNVSGVPRLEYNIQTSVVIDKSLGNYENILDCAAKNMQDGKSLEDGVFPSYGGREGSTNGHEGGADAAGGERPVEIIAPSPAVRGGGEGTLNDGTPTPKKTGDNSPPQTPPFVRRFSVPELSMSVWSLSQKFSKKQGRPEVESPEAERPETERIEAERTAAELPQTPQSSNRPRRRTFPAMRSSPPIPHSPKTRSAAYTKMGRLGVHGFEDFSKSTTSSKTAQSADLFKTALSHRRPRRHTIAPTGHTATSAALSPPPIPQSPKRRSAIYEPVYNSLGRLGIPGLRFGDAASWGADNRSWTGGTRYNSYPSSPSWTGTPKGRAGKPVSKKTMGQSSEETSATEPGGG